MTVEPLPLAEISGTIYWEPVTESGNTCLIIYIIVLSPPYLPDLKLQLTIVVLHDYLCEIRDSIP